MFRLLMIFFCSIFLLFSCSFNQNGDGTYPSLPGEVSSEITFPRKLLPDLKPTNLIITAMTSTHISYTYSVANSGNASVALNTIGFQAWISSTPDSIGTPAGGSILYYTGDLNPGTSFTGDFSCTLAPGILHPETGQYLVIMIDYSNSIIEKSETNNTLSAPIPYTGPDLLPTGLAVTAINSTHISYTYTIANTGTAPSALNTIGFQAWISSTPDSIGTPAGGGILYYTGDLNPGTSFTGDFSCTLAPGILHPETGQYLVLMVDYGNGIAELSETNNTLSAPIPYTGPDLLPTGLAVTAINSTHISYTYTIANTGTASSALNTIDFQAWISSTPDSIGTPAGGGILYYTGDLNPGTSFTGDFSCTLAPGILHPETGQYLVLMVDYGNGIAELSETNNKYSILLH